MVNKTPSGSSDGIYSQVKSWIKDHSQTSKPKETSDTQSVAQTAGLTSEGTNTVHQGAHTQAASPEQNKEHGELQKFAEKAKDGVGAAIKKTTSFAGTTSKVIKEGISNIKTGNDKKLGEARQNLTVSKAEHETAKNELDIATKTFGTGMKGKLTPYTMNVTKAQNQVEHYENRIEELKQHQAAGKRPLDSEADKTLNKNKSDLRKYEAELGKLNTERKELMNEFDIKYHSIDEKYEIGKNCTDTMLAINALQSLKNIDSKINEKQKLIDATNKELAGNQKAVDQLNKEFKAENSLMNRAQSKINETMTEVGKVISGSKPVQTDDKPLTVSSQSEQGLQKADQKIAGIEKRLSLGQQIADTNNNATTQVEKQHSWSSPTHDSKLKNQVRSEPKIGGMRANNIPNGESSVKGIRNPNQDINLPERTEKLEMNDSSIKELNNLTDQMEKANNDRLAFLKFYSGVVTVVPNDLNEPYKLIEGVSSEVIIEPLKKFDKKIAELQNKIDIVKSQIEKNQKAIDEINENISDIESNLQNEYDKEVNKIKNEIKLEAALTTAKNDLQTLHDKLRPILNKSQQILDSNTLTNKEKIARMNSLAPEKEKLLKQIDSKELEIINIENKINGTNPKSVDEEKLAALQEKMSSLVEEHKKLNEEAMHLSPLEYMKFTGKTKEINSLKEEIESLQSKINQDKEEIGG